MVQKPGRINRRTFLKTAGSLAVLLSLPFDLKNVLAAGPGSSAIPDHIMLTWSGNPQSTQTIAWRTDTTVNGGLIQYSPAKASDNSLLEKEAKSVPAAVETLLTDLGNANIHAGVLTGLKPGTKYNYRVGDGVNWSKTFSFTTAPSKASPFKFLFFGDSQSGIMNNPDYQLWDSNVHSAFAAHPDARFFINVGDLTECGQNYIHWDKWFDACQDVIARIPAMPSEGNHETYSVNGNNGLPGWVPPSGSTAEPYEYVRQFKVPQNGPDSLHTQAYSWNYGNVHFAVIDSQFDEEVTADKKPRFTEQSFLNAQAAWLDNDLKNTTAKQWKIVIFHKTPYFNKATRANEKIKATFCPVIDKHHVDLVINGHDHGVSRTYPIKNDTFQSTPARGTVYYVTGRGGRKYYTDLSKKVWDQFFYDANSQPCYIVAQVEGSSLTLKAVNQDGSLIDSYTIDKARGADVPATRLPAAYAAPRVIVYGNDAGEGVNAVQNGAAWYIPLDFVTVSYRNSATGASLDAGTNTYSGGTPAANLGNTNYTADSSRASFTYNKINYTFTAGSTVVGGSTKQLEKPAVYQNGRILIAADDVTRVLGFAWRYDAALNALFLVK